MTASAKAGRYELLGELGRGAMGVVYRAHDPVIGRAVAVKMMRLIEDGTGLSHEELVGRFQTEARAAGQLSHPNIVAVHDAGKEDDLFYITMELVEGQSLEAGMSARQAFPLPRVMRLMQQACSALDFASQRNIVHRDIKPANLMLTPEDTLKITDFGTAKILQFKTAQTGQIIGTPSYMSPEQIKGRPVDGRSDIFSLGVVLYQLLTGEKPFPGDSVTTIIYKIVNEEPVPPRELDSSIHPGLSAVVLRALAKTPAARFQSCAEFLDALQNYRDYQGSSSAAALPASAARPAGAGSLASSPAAVARPASRAPVFSPLDTEPTPAKRGGAIWLALVLLAIIAGGGYRLWPTFIEIWQRGHAAPAPIVEEAPKQSVAPAAPEVSSLPPAAPAPVEVAKPPAPESSAPEPQPKPVATAPVPFAVKPRPANPQPISPAAIEWRGRILLAVAESGLGDKVRVLAAGNTLTLIGKVQPREYRELLGRLKGVPSAVQIIDHVEYSQESGAR